MKILLSVAFSNCPELQRRGNDGVFGAVAMLIVLGA
jgi:hypothetical protein